MTDLVGQTLGGYAVLEQLGAGGMGAVFKARQPVLDRIVALKVIAPQVAQDPSFIARFQHEAKSAARLNHPNIVQVYAAGEDSGTHFMVAEFVEGESLQQRLSREGRMDPQEALATCVFVAEGLKHAWDEAHIIHRDIKPANIFLSNKGAVKVGDLGLAKSVASEASAALTQSGTTVGTPFYCSPEQAQAEKEIDFRADIYSLGCTLYHMLSGKRPYDNGQNQSPMSVMVKQIHDPPPAILQVLPDCPGPVVMLLAKMLAKQPAARHESYDELIADLRRVYDLLGQPQPTVPVSSPQPALVVKKKASSALVYGIAAAAVIMAAGVLLWAPWKVSDKASGKGQAAGVGSASMSPLTEQKQESRETPKTPSLVEPTTEIPARPPEKREQAVAAAAPSVAPAILSPALGVTPSLPPESTSTMAKPQSEPARTQSEVKVTTTAPATVAAASAGNQPPATVDATAEFVKTTAALLPEKQVVVITTRLKELNPQFDGKETHKVENGAVTELAFSTVGVTDIAPIKALPWLKKLSIAPWMTSQKGSLSSLSALQSLPLTMLWCQNNPINDLSPIKGMSLTMLSCGGTQVKDLAPLTDMKLAVLSVNDTEVSDLAPLAGMPLTVLWCNNTRVTDLSPLKAMPLQELRCDFQPERDAAVLREIGTLQKINDVAARVFWARVPEVAGRVGSPATPAIRQPLLSPDGFQVLFNGRDLTGWTPMQTTGQKGDVQQPTAGGWIVQNGELICSTARPGWLKSERQYGDFVLQLEFKLQRDGNSDALIRCPDSGRISRSGMEIQIVDPHFFSDRRATMTPEKLTGAIYGVVGPRQPPVRPAGQWNSMEIRCEGDNVEVMLNGTRTVSANMNQHPELRNRSRSGYVGFSNWQGEAKGTAFRNIRIMDLSTKPASATPSPQTRATTFAVRPTAPGTALGQPFITSIGMELVSIPPGEFMMGSTPEERAWAVQNGCNAQWVLHEGTAPRKTVIKQGFWLGKTEVTVGQWKLFVAATGYVTDGEKKGESQTKRGQVEGANWKDPNFGFKLKDTHPVSYISWNDAVAFCGWLNEREAKAGRLPPGFKMRLPTEAEWEYACRAGKQTKFWWGETKEGGDNRVNWGGKSDGFEFVSPVDNYGSRGRNKFGLADMLGNVWEWCLDEFDEEQAHEECYKGNPKERVLRGGSFFNSPGVVRCAGRHNRAPDYPERFFGFRVMMGVER